MKHLLQILLFLTLFISSCKKEAIVRYGGLKGVINNELGQPVEGAKVTVGSFSALSNASGEYYFNSLETKQYSVSVSKDMYITKVENVTVINDVIIELDFVLANGESFLSISKSKLNATSAAGKLPITVSSNAGWIVIDSSSWLEASVQSGEGNREVNISWTANLGSVERVDSVKFQCGDIVKKLIVTQSTELKMISCRGIIGNGEKNITDSVYLRFNKPITVNRIESTWTYCESDIAYNMVDNGYGVKFTFACADLGGRYSFNISVSDANGDGITKSISVPFYRSELKVEGFITDFLLLGNDKEVVISTNRPERLIWYSIEEDRILQSYDVSSYISPQQIAYNPYDSKIYFVGTVPLSGKGNRNFGLPDIYTLDLQDGQVVKAITIVPDSLDHPESPANIPYNIGFTKSGYGMVLLMSNGSSALRWKFVDCTNNNRVYCYPFPISDADFFDNVQMNSDQTKLITTQTYVGSCAYGIFDGNTQLVSIMWPGSITRSIFITPNRISDKVYFGQLYDQFVMDLDGNMSQISYMDNRNDGSADFSYRDNEDNIIYFCDMDYLQVLDYNSAQTLMWCDVVWGLKKFTTTLDSKYALSYKCGSGTTSSFFVFETGDFYRHNHERSAPTAGRSPVDVFRAPRKP